jgi:hypothetical protein
MTMRVRKSLILLIALAMLGVSSCGHYVCGANFGNSTCAAGQVSLTGSGGGSSAAAFAFVANGTGVGSMVGYTLNTSVTPPTLTGTPNYTAPVTPTADAGIGLAVAQKQFLYAAFGSTQQIFGWTISSTGTLTPVAGTPLLVPTLTIFNATEFDTARVITNPAGTLLFVGDEFADQVNVFQIGSGGALTAASSPVSVPFSPGNMTTDGLGKYLYITDSTGSHTGFGIAAYSIGSSGALTAVSGSPFSGGNFDMWQVQGEPTGQFLIGTKGLSQTVTGSDDDNLYVFSIGASGGLAAPVLSSTTNSPFNIAVQSNSGGNLVDTFGIADSGLSFNPIEGFSLSGGSLSAVNGSPFLNGAVGSEGKFDQSGGLLFVYGGVFDNNTVVYTLTSFDVGSGTLTTPTGTGTYGGYWVVTDAP